MLDTLTIIIDMQNDFTYDALKNEDAIKIIPNMIDFIKDSENNNELVIFTQDTHYSDYLNTQEGKYLPIPHCIKGSKGHNVCDSLLNSSKNKICIEKPTFGMNMQSWQECILKYFSSLDDVKLVKLCGTCTEICVVSNALILKSLLPNAEFIVYEDLCAGLTKEKHLAALDVMRSCQIKVTKYKD